ncbi:MAG: hypothetical protein QNK37_38835 [Acidobacteriota bacterium]|nr:hypothetical protein [Acidobacteriota bacterium]
MVDLKRGEVWFFDDPTVIQVGFFGLYYKGSLPRPAPPEPEQVEAFSKLYHYDPWWVLAEEPFADAEWVPPMKGTNVGEDPNLEGLAFDRKLKATVPPLWLDAEEPKPKKKGWSLRPPPKHWRTPGRTSPWRKFF